MAMRVARESLASRGGEERSWSRESSVQKVRVSAFKPSITTTATTMATTAGGVARFRRQADRVLVVESKALRTSPLAWILGSKTNEGSCLYLLSVGTLLPKPSSVTFKTRSIHLIACRRLTLKNSAQKSLQSSRVRCIRLRCFCM